MNKKLQNVLYFFLNTLLVFAPSISMAAIEDIQKSFNTHIRSEIMNALSSTALGWGGIGGQIFAICFAIAMIDAFKKFGPEMLMSLVSLGLKSWIVMALVGGPTYSPEISRSLFNQQGSGSLDLDLFNFLAGIADDYAERLNLVDGLPASLALTTETAKINVFIHRMFKSSKECKADGPTDAYTACVDQIIKKGEQDPKPGEAQKKPEDPNKKKDWMDWIAAFGSSVLDLIEIITHAIVFIYTGVFPFALLILTMIRFGANMCIFIILGLTTAVSMMLAKIIVPFYLLKQFEGTVLKSVKVPMSAALYGFAQALVILLGYAIMKGVNQAVNAQFVDSMTKGGSSGLEMAAEMINMFAALYITQGLIVIMQIMALLKIPSFCQDLLNLQLGNFVKFGEELFKAGVGMLGTVAQISMAVASGGAALGGMVGNFAGIGGMLGKVSGAASGLTKGVTSGIGSKINNSALGKAVSAGGNRIKDRWEKTTGFSLSGPGSGVSVDSVRTSRGGGSSDVSSAASGLANESMFPRSSEKSKNKGSKTSERKRTKESSESKGGVFDRVADFTDDIAKRAFSAAAGKGGGDLTDTFIKSGLAGAQMINNLEERKGETATDREFDKSSLKYQTWIANKFSARPEERSAALASVSSLVAPVQKTMLTKENSANLTSLLAKETLSQAESDQVSNYLTNNIMAPDQEERARSLISKTQKESVGRINQGRSSYANAQDYENDMAYVFKNKNRELLNNDAKLSTSALSQTNKDYAKYEQAKQQEVQSHISNIQERGLGTQGSLLAADALIKNYNDGAVSKEQMAQLSSTIANEEKIERTNFENKIRAAQLKESMGMSNSQDMLELKNTIESNKNYLVGNNEMLKVINDIRNSNTAKTYPMDLSFDPNDFKADPKNEDFIKTIKNSFKSRIEEENNGFSYNEKDDRIEVFKKKADKNGNEKLIRDEDGNPIIEEASSVSADFTDSLTKEIENIRNTRLLMNSNKDAYISKDINGKNTKAGEELHSLTLEKLDEREKLINKALAQVAAIKLKNKKK